MFCAWSGSSYEGGIRTPAIIKGGFIEKMLQSNTELTDNMCEYHGMVHISDWYDIIMDVTEISDDNYSPDSDHENLEIFKNIRCKCKNSNNPYTDLGNQLFCCLPLKR